jgi:hypothetical protein
MADRPVFVPATNEPAFVREVTLSIPWSPGFAVVQKQKNIVALRDAAAAVGIAPVLEVSTKSEEKLGRHLSAFHLKVRAQGREMPLESAFQGSKVFERGGPFEDLYAEDARAAKRDPRIQCSGKLVAFHFFGTRFPLFPKTVFYDWLYVSALFEHRAWLRTRLPEYGGFSDIEFNPARSINCQARSCALFVALMSRDLLEQAVRSPESFITLMTEHAPPSDAATTELFTE